MPKNARNPMGAIGEKTQSSPTWLHGATVRVLVGVRVRLLVVGGVAYVGLTQTRDALSALFNQQVQTLNDVSEMRVRLSDLRRAEQEIFLNYNHVNQDATQRIAFAGKRAALRGQLVEVRKRTADDGKFTECIDKALADIKNTRRACRVAGVRAGQARATRRGGRRCVRRKAEAVH